MKKSNLQEANGGAGSGSVPQFRGPGHGAGDGAVPRFQGPVLGAGERSVQQLREPDRGAGAGDESAAQFPELGHGAGLHVAIIMDGNGRWAVARALPRIAGHRHGALAVRRTIEAAPGLGIRTLTLYAFSSDNWRRPAEEVSALMRLLHEYLRKETDKCVEEGVRVSLIGRRDRIPEALREIVEEAERATAHGRRLHLRIAVDYSARDAILRAANRRTSGELTREEFGRLLAEASHEPAPAPDVDLLIRTGGEQRLSDFLLWEAAYAELHFTRRMWPEFQAADLEAAVRDYHGRQRRFGAVPEAAAV